MYFLTLVLFFSAQPRGQPEIVRKSLARCSVEGNQEMFIIGKNFHRGTKVVFQDSKEPDGNIPTLFLRFQLYF